MLQGIVTEVVREHVEQAAFQWAQHRMLSAAHPPDAAAVAHVAARLVANLDGVLIAGDDAWPIILDRFEDFPEAGELFVAGYLAMALNGGKRIDQCLWMAHQAPEARHGLAAALAWFPPAISGPTVRRMLDADSATVRATALDVLAHHRADLGARLAGCLADPAPIVCASACALAAATGRADCVEAITGHAGASDPDLRFAGAAALAALGHSGAVAALKAETEGPRAAEALRILSRLLNPADFRSWLGALYHRDATRTLAVRGIGMTGDRSHLGWLIAQMEVPETAAAAGESFLELFPEAAGVEGLFSDDVAVLGPDFPAAQLTAADVYPIAKKVRGWATDMRFPA
jgi:uncharacterized protein (TIGR02270 family)